MMEKEIQVDLFEQVSPNKKRKRTQYSSLRKIFPYGFVNIRVSYEGIIFSLIVFLLICVVLFSLGMERGKGLMQDKRKSRLTIGSSINYSENIAQNQIIPKTTAVPSIDTKTASIPKLDVGEDKSASKTVKYKYTIQIAAYKGKTLATKRIGQLVSDGYKPFIIYSGGLYQICIGKYPSKENARKELSRLRKKYGSGYIRNIP